MSGARLAGWAARVMGFYVRRRTGEHQAIELLQQVGLIDLIAERGNYQWHAPGNMHNGLQVFVTGGVVDVVPDLLGTGTNADYRLARQDRKSTRLNSSHTQISFS